MHDGMTACVIIHSEDESEIWVVETYAGRIRRVYLTGTKRGTDDIVVNHMPVFPDGMSRGRHSYWVACPSPQPPTATLIAPYPTLRALISKLPSWLMPKPVRAVALSPSIAPYAYPYLALYLHCEYGDMMHA